ncbi:MAG: hypothetical protein ACLPSL_12655 [Smithella sp.]
MTEGERLGSLKMFPPPSLRDTPASGGQIKAGLPHRMRCGSQ